MEDMVRKEGSINEEQQEVLINETFLEERWTLRRPEFFGCGDGDDVKWANNDDEIKMEMALMNVQYN